MLSDLQKQKVTKLFNVLDADGSGYFEESDLDNLASRLGEGRTAKQVQELREKYHAIWQSGEAYHEDGRIDLEGFLEHQDELLNTPGAYEGTVRELTDFIIQLLDSDGDGKVTKPEMERFYRAYDIDAGQAGPVFDSLDMNQDGYISRSELLDHVGDFFFSSSDDAPGNALFGPLDTSPR